MEMRREPKVAVDPAVFRAVVRAAFSTRRKTLRNSLRQRFVDEALDEALKASGIDPKRRAETLSLEEFALLSRTLAPVAKFALR
jgi:16S rRNA (adenine1518-N6/adenine1519-N6)-dimethyltransferase